MPYDTPDIQPGSYDGLADVLVIREILENAEDREAAESYLQSVARTWTIWLGVGDYASQRFDLVGYKQKDVTVYSDETIGQETGQPLLKDICYVDKHPQPSTATDLPELLQSYAGNVTFGAVQDIVQQHGTGDVHWASYDFLKKKMVVAVGRVDENGKYQHDSWKAYGRPALLFDLEDLWAGK